MPRMKDVQEALDTATKSVLRAQRNASSDVFEALVTLLDAVSMTAALLGVPNAVEPETGGTDVEVR